MFIPSSLKATTTFTHIMQTKMPGNGTAPIMVMSLRRHGNTPKIELKVFSSNTLIGAADLAPLQNAWVDTEVEFTSDDAPRGHVRWVLRKGASTVLDVEKSRVDTWLGDRVRPKWGIYRSLGDRSGALQNTYLLLTRMRAYQLVGAGAPASQPPPGPGVTAAAAKPGATAAPPAATRGLTAEQRRRADQLVSAFENSTTQIQYGYAENLHDGRGVTSGRAGFCTGTGDAVVVVERYTARVPGNPLARFLPELRRLANEESSDTSRLPEAAYVKAWKQAAGDQVFRQVQDQVVDEMYFNPAMRHADQAGLTTALARAELYDAIIQHGDGSDPDGIGALLRRTRSKAGGTPATGVDERTWLGSFFEVRIADLQNPANSDSRDEWAESVDRVRSVQRIARTGNYDLHGPITFTAFGDRFTID
jgi:chitosanase